MLQTPSLAPPASSSASSNNSSNDPSNTDASSLNAPLGAETDVIYALPKTYNGKTVTDLFPEFKYNSVSTVHHFEKYYQHKLKDSFHRLGSKIFKVIRSWTSN